MRILLVASRFPLPPWRGNQLRTVQWLDALADHRCALLCPAGDASVTMTGERLEVITLPRRAAGGIVGAAAGFLRGRPAQEGLYGGAAARRLLDEVLTSFVPDLVVVQMVRSAWAVGRLSALPNRPRVLFDAIDCMGMHFERAASSVNRILRPIYRLEARRCREREAELVRRAAVTTAVSRRDLEALAAGARGHVVPVTGGVAGGRRRTPPACPTVLLSGNLGYRPTVRAACWFAARVWPELRRRVPTARWILAGARPAAAVRRLGRLDGVEVHGDVADLGAFLDRATVAIAPMAEGSGVPIKVLEAMAAGVPVVADPWAAGGLLDVEAVAVAADAAEWARVLQRLLTDPVAARDQVAAGAEAWRNHYHPRRVRQAVRAAVSDASR